MRLIKFQKAIDVLYVDAKHYMKPLEAILFAQIVVSQGLVEEEGGEIIKRDTYGYKMWHKGKIVQHGITKNPEDRPSDHSRDNKRFTSISFDKYPRTWDGAKAEETRRIQEYEKSHGKKPRHNKIH